MYEKCNKIITHLNSIFTHCCLTYTHIIIEQNTFEKNVIVSQYTHKKDMQHQSKHIYIMQDYKKKSQ
jgi:hypothetical protein